MNLDSQGQEQVRTCRNNGNGLTIDYVSTLIKLLKKYDQKRGTAASLHFVNHVITAETVYLVKEVIL